MCYHAVLMECHASVYVRLGIRLPSSPQPKYNMARRLIMRASHALLWQLQARTAGKVLLLV